MSDVLTFRPGLVSDASDLTILLDACSRRTVAWNWSRMAAPGQSWFEVGRNRIRNQPETISYHAKWQVAEWQGVTVGAFQGASIEVVAPDAPLDHADGPFRPLAELERLAMGGWAVLALTVFPEYRGRGFGRLLLDRACETGRAAGHDSIALQVDSGNLAAVAMYQAAGFTERARRPFGPFLGSDDVGEWILLVQDRPSGAAVGPRHEESPARA